MPPGLSLNLRAIDCPQSPEPTTRPPAHLTRPALPWYWHASRGIRYRLLGVKPRMNKPHHTSEAGLPRILQNNKACGLSAPRSHAPTRHMSRESACHVTRECSCSANNYTHGLEDSRAPGAVGLKSSWQRATDIRMI
jgi:hypothetical protein